VHLVGSGTARRLVVAGTGAHQVQPAAGIDPVVSAGADQHVVEPTADHAADVDQPVAALARGSAAGQVDVDRSGRRPERDTHIEPRSDDAGASGGGADQVVPGTQIDKDVLVSGQENGVIAGAGDDGAPPVVEMAADVTYVVSFSEVDAEGGEAT